MSRHPSPGPSHIHAHQPPAQASRQRARPYSMGIAAGAEDVKYQAKYKELKRKVKEIETDNDILQFKVLQAKRSIQRMKLERAILYERISTLPPSPPIDERHGYPPVQPGPGLPHHSSGHPMQTGPSHRDARDASHLQESDQNLMEYIRTTGNPRVAPGPDGRPVPVMDAPMGPGVAPSARLISSGHVSRRDSSSSEVRQLPPLAPPSHIPHVQHLEPPRGHSHSSHSSHSHSSPHMHHPGGSSHERASRSMSGSHNREQLQPLPRNPGPEYSHRQQYQEPLPPVQHVLHSPLSESERGRRHDMHEHSFADPHAHARHQPSMAPLSPHSHSSRHGHGHGHQRMGPGTYINRNDEYHERDLDRDYEWERSRDHSSRVREGNSGRMHSPHASRHRELPDHPPSSRMRDEPPYPPPDMPGGGPYVSRSGSPGSGSGDGPSRPDSRSQQYDQQERRNYRLRPINPNDQEQVDFAAEDGRGQGRGESRDRGIGGGGGFPPPPEQHRASLDPKKRSRNDIEDAEMNDVGEGQGYAGGRQPEDRGSKRYHRDSSLLLGPDRAEEDL
ncbi:hypothetical protein HGRIS_009321 [Hohenbuehelia grisea]|uniref:INO80 complex subunit F domain-containing protein n=1 Tax=Hohenbuehelia grisea TaxID=104357 RepID=A0ABR3J157_9AGAR